MTSKATTVEQYLAELPEDRRTAIEAVRDEIKRNLPKGYEEGMQYGMIGYYVPHSIYPAGYHCDKTQPLPFAHIASQKNHMAVYLFCLYGNEELQQRFTTDYLATGKKLDKGASCVRFTKLENLALDVIGKHIAAIPVDKFIAGYEGALQLAKAAKEARKQSKTKS